jgi:hypothetical protein
MDCNILPGFGKDQWIKYRWNRSYDNPYPEHDFEVFLKPKVSSTIISLDIASNNVVEDICNTYKNKKIYLAMSGGVDSEFVANTLLKNNIDFIPIIFNVDDHNLLDTWWAYRWCKENKISYKNITISIDDYFENMINIAKKFCAKMVPGAPAAEYCANLARENDGILLSGCAFNELYIPDPIMFDEANDPKLMNKIGYVHSEIEIIKAMLMPDMPITFLNWTPEITLSYIAARDPNKNTEENRFNLYKCSPRPKTALPVPHYLFENNHKIKGWYQLWHDIGTTTSYYLGTSKELINLLTQK